MTNLKAFFLTLTCICCLLFATTNTAFAGTNSSSKKVVKLSLSEQIQDRIGSPKLDLDAGTNSNAVVTFGIDDEGKLIVLAVNNEHPEIVSYINQNLNRSQLNVSAKVIGKTYRIPLNFHVK